MCLCSGSQRPTRYTSSGFCEGTVIAAEWKLVWVCIHHPCFYSHTDSFHRLSRDVLKALQYIQLESKGFTAGFQPLTTLLEHVEVFVRRSLRGPQDVRSLVRTEGNNELVIRATWRKFCPVGAIPSPTLSTALCSSQKFCPMNFRVGSITRLPKRARGIPSGWTALAPIDVAIQHTDGSVSPANHLAISTGDFVDIAVTIDITENTTGPAGVYLNIVKIVRLFSASEIEVCFQLHTLLHIHTLT